MPVLALALVVEARAIIRTWIPGQNRAAKSIQGFIWTASLLTYAVTEPVCLRALAGDQVWAGWTTVIQLGVQVGIGTLILAPAIEFFTRANARALVLIRPVVIQNYWLTKKFGRMSKRLHRNWWKQTEEIQDWRTATLAELDQLEAKWTALPDSDDRTSALHQVAELRAGLLERIVADDERLKQVDKDFAERKTKLAEFEARRRQLLDSAEAAIERRSAEGEDDRPDATPTPSS